MIILVECWNKLDGHVGELSSWVSVADPVDPTPDGGLSIIKLETQLETLKTNFAEKQQLVDDIRVSCRARTPEKDESRKASQLLLRRETIVPDSVLSMRY